MSETAVTFPLSCYWKSVLQQDKCRFSAGEEHVGQPLLKLLHDQLENHSLHLPWLMT